MLLVSIGSLLYSRHWIADVFAPYFSRSHEVVRPKPVPEPHETGALPTGSGTCANSTGFPSGESTAGSQPENVPSASIPVALPVPDLKEEPRGPLRLEFEVVQKCWVSVKP